MTDVDRFTGVDRFTAIVYYDPRVHQFILCVTVIPIGIGNGWRGVQVPVADQSGLTAAYASAQRLLVPAFRVQGLDLAWPQLTPAEVEAMWSPEGVTYDRVECQCSTSDETNGVHVWHNPLLTSARRRRKVS